MAALTQRLPPDILALAAGSGPLHFCYVFADQREGMGAFLAKRKATFTGQ